MLSNPLIKQALLNRDNSALQNEDHDDYPKDSVAVIYGNSHLSGGVVTQDWFFQDWFKLCHYFCLCSTEAHSPFYGGPSSDTPKADGGSFNTGRGFGTKLNFLGSWGIIREILEMWKSSRVKKIPASKMAARALPQTFSKLIVRQISPKFREATEIVKVPMLTPGSGQLLVKNKYVGINASDINFTAGRYDPTLKVPFDCGFEGIADVVAVGPDCKRLKPGQSVGYTQYGAFSEYTLIKESSALPIPEPKPEYLPLIVSGLTASISLDKMGELKAGEKVLVTAAAGGTGQFAVQWAKQAGCHVIGVCSSQDKVKFLKSIGCDRAINYSEEDLKATLKKEYPEGVDVVYECVGGKTFEICVQSMAEKGRLIVIGYISGYESDTGASSLTLQTPALIKLLLWRSISVKGFLLFHYTPEWKEYLLKMVELYSQGKIKSAVDLGSAGKTFQGLESVADAVDYMYQRKNVGKIVVSLDDTVKSKY